MSQLETAHIVNMAASATLAGFGFALGVPITTHATLTGLPAHALSAIVGRQLPLLALVLPSYAIVHRRQRAPRQAAGRSWRPHLSPTLMATANSSGAVMSKVISPQNVTTGVSTTSLNGKEGLVIRRMFLHSIALAALLGLLAMAQQYLVPGVLPH